jgi:hypothetical protein
MAHFIPSAGVRPKGSYNSPVGDGSDRIDVKYLRIAAPLDGRDQR